MSSKYFHILYSNKEITNYMINNIENYINYCTDNEEKKKKRVVNSINTSKFKFSDANKINDLTISNSSFNLKEISTMYFNEFDREENEDKKILITENINKDENFNDSSFNLDQKVNENNTNLFTGGENSIPIKENNESFYETNVKTFDKNGHINDENSSKNTIEKNQEEINNFFFPSTKLIPNNKKDSNPIPNYLNLQNPIKLINPSKNNSVLEDKEKISNFRRFEITKIIQPQNNNNSLIIENPQLLKEFKYERKNSSGKLKTKNLSKGKFNKKILGCSREKIMKLGINEETDELNEIVNFDDKKKLEKIKYENKRAKLNLNAYINQTNKKPKFDFSSENEKSKDEVKDEKKEENCLVF